MIDLEKLKQELEQISKWPWHAVPIDGNEYQRRGDVISVWSESELSMTEKDAEFIAKAPERIAALVAEVERLCEELRNVEDALGYATERIRELEEHV